MDSDLNISEGFEGDDEMLKVSEIECLPSSTLGKRKSFIGCGVTAKTLIRWKITGSVNVDHLLGFGPDATPEETRRAEETLSAAGQVVCCICGMGIAANKKSVKRHQLKNRKHLSVALELATNGQFTPNTVVAMRVAGELLSAESACAPSNQQPAKLPRSLETPAIPTKHPVLGQEAWEIITQPEKVLLPDVLGTLLSDLGVYEGKDLFYCSPSELNEIASSLKKVPQRRFRQIFGMQLEDPGASLFDMDKIPS